MLRPSLVALVASAAAGSVFVCIMVIVGLMCWKRVGRERRRRQAERLCLSEPLLTETYFTTINADDDEAEYRVLSVIIPTGLYAILEQGGLVARGGNDLECGHDRRFLHLLDKFYPLTRRDLTTGRRLQCPTALRPRVWSVLLQTGSRLSSRSGAVAAGMAGGGAGAAALDMEVGAAPSVEEAGLLAQDLARSRFPLVSDGSGRVKLQRLVERWLARNPGCEYKQGMDTLAAMVLSGGFVDNEDGALLCLGQLIDKYMPDYFVRGSTEYLMDKMRMLECLLAFWDPELWAHLRRRQVMPEMFAVPWLVTLFADIFPFHKALYLWDTMVVFGGEFAVFMAVATLIANRHAILVRRDFTECMLFFSQLNEGGLVHMNLRYVVLKTLSMYSQTPTRRARGLMADLADPKGNSALDAVANFSHHSVLCLDLQGVLAIRPDALCVIDLRSCSAPQRRRLAGTVGKNVKTLTIPVPLARSPASAGGDDGSAAAAAAAAAATTLFTGGDRETKLARQVSARNIGDQRDRCKALIRKHLPQLLPYKGRYMGLCADDQCAFLNFAHTLSFEYRFNRVFVFELPSSVAMDLSCDLSFSRGDAGLPQESF